MVERNSSLKHIGYYYSDNGLMNLYSTAQRLDNWVTNICYYDTFRKICHSPSLQNIAINGRSLDWKRYDEVYWTRFMNSSHSSFVLPR